MEEINNPPAEKLNGTRTIISILLLYAVYIGILYIFQFNLENFFWRLTLIYFAFAFLIILISKFIILSKINPILKGSIIGGVIGLLSNIGWTIDFENGTFLDMFFSSFIFLNYFSSQLATSVFDISWGKLSLWHISGIFILIVNILIGSLLGYIGSKIVNLKLRYKILIWLLVIILIIVINGVVIFGIAGGLG